jgi:hypothetical protein
MIVQQRMLAQILGRAQWQARQQLGYVCDGFRGDAKIRHTERLSTRVLATVRIWIQRSRGPRKPA